MPLQKVLVVSFDPVPAADGKGVRVEAILKALQGRYDVDLLCPRADEQPHIELRHCARVLRVPLPRGHLHARSEAFARALWRQLDSEEYRLVHLADARVAGPACELAPARGFRMVYEPLGAPVLDLARVFPRLAANVAFVERLRAAERLCLAQADAVIVGSARARRYVEAQGGFGDKVSVLPGAVDLSAFRPSRATHVGRPRVVYAGEIAPWQGIGTLLRAAREVLRVRSTVRFSLTGPGRPQHREALVRLARRLGVEAALSLSPEVPHERVPELLAEADVCVVPTEEDERALDFGPFALKAAEAMATARAVALSRVPAHTEVASEGDEGCFFAPGDADELAGILLRLLASPEEREALGQRAHARIREEASEAVFRERLLAIYGDLLGEGAASRRFAESRTVPQGRARP